MTTPERIYWRLLRVYPADFRRDYGEPMAQLFADQLRDARGAGAWAGTLGLWIRTLLDISTSAASQHLERDRTVAHSTAAIPTTSARAFGIVGVLAGVFLIAPFVITLGDRWLHPRNLVFTLFVMALGLGLHSRQAAGSPVLARLASAIALAGYGATFIWLVLSTGRANPHAGEFGYIGFITGMAMWVSAALYGLISFRIGAVTRWGSVLLVVGSVLALTGIDRMGLVVPGHESIFGPLSQIGIVMHGVGWILLGAELALRGTVARAPSA
jgi:hypothetical protein